MNQLERMRVFWCEKRSKKSRKNLPTKCIKENKENKIQDIKFISNVEENIFLDKD